MKSKWFRSIAALCAFSLLETATWASSHPRYKLLHTFHDMPAEDPCSTLISDSAGNLYGTSCGSLHDGGGVIYELSPTASGGWVYQVLHVLTLAEGYSPTGKLLLDTAGNLYGTTSSGGANQCGTVYELTPSSGGRWKAKILHTFAPYGSVYDGCEPLGGLAMDAQGNLYGGTHLGGHHNDGAVFTLTLGSDGEWTETVLHSFTESEFGPQTGLLFNATGNLFGATEFEVFVLARNSHGGWTESVAHTFDDGDGLNPFGDLTFDKEGNLYGTNQAGGVNRGGTVFKLTPNTNGGWASTVLASFPTNTADGYYPLAGVALDSSGNVYGTTGSGGSDDDGVVFKLTPSHGKWTERLLHNFTGARDGKFPEAGVTLDASGNLYGSAIFGGQTDLGVAFEIVP
jgi:uncharacterized repeat protein (TIGR03803 family)